MKFISLLILCVSPFALAQSNPVPLVNSPLVPGSAMPGGQDFQLTVNGTGFVASSAVQWNGQALATTFVSASQLNATVPAADIAAAGTASVTVKNPSPGGGASNVALFTVRVPFSAASFKHADFSIASQPVWATVADLNDDGKLDLVTAVRGKSIEVLMGKGDGTFQSPITYPLAGDPNVVVAADLNNDGKLDLAASTAAGSISILLGRGDGTFRHHIDSDLNLQVGLLTTGDFNMDGKLDLAVQIGIGGKVGVLLGNGDGTFFPVVIYNAGSDRAFGVVTGDFNDDGILDLAVSVFSDSSVAILLGNGDGTFQPASEYATAFGGGFLAAGDFNGDGHLDLAVQIPFNWVSVLLGRGDGTFPIYTDYEIRFGDGVTVADVNGDGRLDIVVPNLKYNTVSTLLGAADGTFQKRSDFATGQGPMCVVAGDFDGDGKLDILTANNATLSVLPQITSVLSRTYVNFGHVEVGDSVKRKVTFTNIGDSSFRINGISLVGRSRFGYTENHTCGPELDPGASCKIDIVFTPETLGPYSHAGVKISDTITKQKIYLQGTGVK